MKEPLIVLNNIEKAFRHVDIATLALQGISLTVTPGEFIAITGPSGCGKSTLLSILGLMDKADAGDYLLAGINTQQLSTNQRTAIRNQHLGFVFQSFNLIDAMTVFENVALPLQHRGVKRAAVQERVQQCLALVDMAHRASFYPNQLSGGQQQRIAIARALAGSPQLLLVDEPTGNLDSKNGDAIMHLLQQLNQQGTTIVMVTHDFRYSSLASRQIQMLDGQIIAEQKIQDIA